MSGSALCLPGSEDPEGLQSPEVREDFKCLRSGEEGGLGGQKAPRSEGQSPPSGIRGDPDLRDLDLKGYLRQLLQQPCSYPSAHAWKGAGLGAGCPPRTLFSPRSSLLPPGPPASSGIVLLRVSQLPAAVQGTSMPISSHILSPTAAGLALFPGPCPPDQLSDLLRLTPTLRAHSSPAIAAHRSWRVSLSIVWPDRTSPG